MWSLASTEQYVEIPHNVSCMLLDKSTLARRGLAVQNTLIDPGFRGYITLELSNHGNEILELKKGQPIGQLLFAWLDEATEQPYNGKYQDQPNRPVEAIKEN
jgi:dCTP deaminase